MQRYARTRADVAGDPNNPDISIAWKYLWTAKDTWPGSEQDLGATGALYNLTMDPFENTTCCSTALLVAVVMDFNKSIVDFPSKKRIPGGASNDWRPNLQRPADPVPLPDMKKLPQVKSMGVDRATGSSADATPGIGNQRRRVHAAARRRAKRESPDV
jgi:hypothetical protein